MVGNVSQNNLMHFVKCMGLQGKKLHQIRHEKRSSIKDESSPGGEIKVYDIRCKIE